MNLCYCGHDCSRCVTHLATLTHSDDLRLRAQNFYVEMGYRFPPEELSCMGGRTDHVFFLCKQCPFVRCCREKGISSCTLCSAPCEQFKNYSAHYVNQCNQI